MLCWCSGGAAELFFLCFDFVKLQFLALKGLRCQIDTVGDCCFPITSSALDLRAKSPCCVGDSGGGAELFFLCFDFFFKIAVSSIK